VCAQAHEEQEKEKLLQHCPWQEQDLLGSRKKIKALQVRALSC
jgi:hypothetical protein